MIIQQITDGIVKKLHNAFPDTQIYATEDVAQGIQVELEPDGIIPIKDNEASFFVFNVASSEKPLLYPRFSYTNLFDIHYFPEKANNNREMRSIASLLYPLLDWVELDDGSKVRGTNKNDRITAGVLHFFTNLNCVAYRKSQSQGNEEMMKEYKHWANDILIGGTHE